MTLADIMPALPEIFLALATLALLLFGVFGGQRATRAMPSLAVGTLLLALCAVMATASADTQVVFNGLFMVDDFARFIKILLLTGAAMALVAGQPYAARHMNRFEYPVLVLLATLGTLCMVSAGDMLALYVGLELQSLALYILAAFRRDDARGAEAGLKYFVLGALASGILLFGISLLYGATTATNFDQIAAALKTGASPMALTGLVFVLAGLAFKVSAAPFHMWVPDVYEGAPTPATMFFAAVPKVAAFALLLRVMFGALAPAMASWQPVVAVMALASMAVGALAALRQTNIKRLMAYSAIGHVGYALVGVAAAAGGNAQNGVASVLLYQAIYFIMTLGVFALVLGMRRDGRQVELIDDLAGLGRAQPLPALALAALLFSMAGVPPLAGFFGKYAVFLAAVQAGQVVLAVAGVLLSAVSAYYYIRIIKVMYFDEASAAPIDALREPQLRLVLGMAAAYVLLFALYPSHVADAAAAAARSLLG